MRMLLIFFSFLPCRHLTRLERQFQAPESSASSLHPKKKIKKRGKLTVEKVTANWKEGGRGREEKKSNTCWKVKEREREREREREKGDFFSPVSSSSSTHPKKNPRLFLHLHQYSEERETGRVGLCLSSSSSSSCSSSSSSSSTSSNNTTKSQLLLIT